jgi:hypothetical protein
MSPNVLWILYWTKTGQTVRQLYIAARVKIHCFLGASDRNLSLTHWLLVYYQHYGGLMYFGFFIGQKQVKL